MTSKTSWFSGAVFRKRMTSLWPLWVLYTIVLLLCIPFNLLAQHDESLYWFGRQLLRFSYQWGLVLTAIYAIMCAVALFGYLFRPCSAYMFHAFPVRRETLFGTNVLCGLLFCLAPNALVLLLGVAAAAGTGSGLELAICQCMAVMSMEYLFCFGLAVLCVMLTGTAIYAVGLYGIMHVAAFALEFFVRGLFGPLIYGYYQNGHIALLPFSPVLWIAERCWVTETPVGTYLTQWGDEMVRYQYSFTGWQYPAIAAAVGVALLVAALLLYRRRHLETAGDVMSVKLLRRPFQYALALAGTLGLGIPMVALLYGGIDADQNFIPVLLSMILGCFLGYFAAEMMLQKTVRVFRWKRWLGFFACVACILLAFGAVRVDLFSIEKRVPELRDVEAVSVDWENNCSRSALLEEPDQIVDVLELHQALIDEKAQTRQTLRRYNADLENGVERPDTWTTQIHIQYTLKNGNVLIRSYTVPITATALAEPSSLAAKLAAFCNDPQTILTYLDCEEAGNEKARWSGTIYYNQMDGDTYYEEGLGLAPAQAKQLYACLLADAAEGTIGQAPALQAPDNGVAFNVRFELSLTLEKPSVPEETTCWYVGLQSTNRSTHTNAFLKQCGIDPETGEILDRALVEQMTGENFHLD